MQDRYAGDFGDFVKLALLRALSPGYQLGMAWWRSPDEKHNDDGRHIGYLRHPGDWRAYDPGLFDGLERVVASGARHVQALQDAALLPSAIYASEMIPTGGSSAERRAGRAAWFARIQSAMAGCTMVFADPDNGLETTRYSPGARRGAKSIALAEVAALAEGGRTLVIYHHHTRMKGGHLAELGHWAARLRGKGFSQVDAIRSSSYSPRAFFILNAPFDVRMRAEALVAHWHDRLSWHPDSHV